MNKKIIILIASIVLIACLGFGVWFMSVSNNTNSDNNSNTNINKYNNLSNGNVAIIYFSATGTTEKIAGYIKEVTGGDLIEIVPKQKYTDDDLNYGNEHSRANKEQNDSKARPEIASSITTDTYDVIYLGYPIWWGDVPKIILTFLDSHNLNGKTVIPFCTSGSTGISDSLNTLKNYNKNVTWIDGKRFASETSKNEVSNWVKGINY